MKSPTGLSDFTFSFHFHALEKEMATHSSVLSWRIPGMGEPDGLLSMGSHRVGHDWGDLAAAVCHCKKFAWKHHSAWRGVKEKELTIAVKCDNILGEGGCLGSCLSPGSHQWLKGLCWTGGVLCQCFWKAGIWGDLVPQSVPHFGLYYLAYQGYSPPQHRTVKFPKELLSLLAESFMASVARQLPHPPVRPLKNKGFWETS